MSLHFLTWFAGRHRKAIKVTLWSLVAFFVFMAVESVHVHKRERFTCLECRTERYIKSFAGFGWETRTENEFTQWHSAHRPSHQHQWERSSCTISRSLLGTRRLWGCRQAHPIFLLPPGIELKFVRKAIPSEVDAFFQSLNSTNRDQQRLAVDTAWKTILQED